MGRWLIRKLNHFLGRIFERRRIDQSLATFLLSLISITLTIFLIIVVVEVMGMNASTFLALFAAAGLAIGMALSGTMQNFAGGVMVLLLKPYRIGDYIEAQGQAGTVKSIQLFNTVITTPDNKTIIIPNGPISTGIVNNYSREPVRRVDWNFGIDYSQDFDTVQKIIRAILASDERVLKEREILVEVNSLGPISVNLLVSAWVKSTDNLVVFYAMNHRFLNELKAQGIEFPNVTDIKIDSDKL